MFNEKTKQLYVLPTYAKYHSTTTSFDFLMFKGDIFTLVINFFGTEW